MYNRLLGQIEDKNLLVEKLFGFRKNLTNEIANYELFNAILNARNYKLIVRGNFYDVAGAFDFVNYTELSNLIFFNNCENYGWIILFLGNNTTDLRNK
jgi:hypothetical protein